MTKPKVTITCQCIYRAVIISYNVQVVGCLRFCMDDNFLAKPELPKSTDVAVD
jgi:hypothetical protein